MNNSITYKAGKIFFSDSGKGQAVILLHGFLEDRSMWKSLSKDLSNDYRVITIDLPGHGETSGFDSVHSMEEMARSVKAVVDDLDLDHVILMGHSMGGYVSLAYSELYAGDVKGLCLLNSTSKADSEEKKVNRDRAADAAIQDPSKFVSMLIPNLFDQNTIQRFERDIQVLIKKASKMSGMNIAAALKGMKLRPDRESILRQLDSRAMVVVGIKDPVIELQSIHLQTKNSDIKLVELDGGHMSFIEHKEDLSYHFMQFIEFL